MVIEVSLRFLRLFHFSFGNTDFFVYMDGHPQATVVLFPCSLSTQGFKEAPMGITSCASTLFACLFLAPWSVARGGSVTHIDRLPYVRLMGFSWADGDHDPLMMMVVSDSARDAS